MNKVFKIVFNTATGKWVVVSELAKSRVKKASLSAISSEQALEQENTERTLSPPNLSPISASILTAFGVALVVTAFGVSSTADAAYLSVNGTTGQVTPSNGSEPQNPVSGSAILTARTNNGGVNSVTIGAGVNTRNKEGVVAIGKDVQIGSGNAKGEAVAIGYSAQVGEAQGTSVGVLTYAGGQATAIGSNVYATGTSSIAIGNDDITEVYSDNLPLDTFLQIYTSGNASNGALTAAKNGVTPLAQGSFDALYKNSRQYSPTFARGKGAIAIGSRTVAYADGTTSLGTLSFALGDRSTAIGLRAFANFTATGATAIGEESRVFAANTLAVGNRAEATNDGSNAYGNKAKAVGKGSLAIGDQVSANGQITNADSLARSIKTVAAMQSNNVGEAHTLVNGNTPATTGINNVVNEVKNFSYQTEGNTIINTSSAVKKTAKTGDNAVALGYNVASLGSASVAMGSATMVRAPSSVGIGSLTYVSESSSNSLAMGVGANIGVKSDGTDTDASNSIAIGTAATARAQNSINLGSGTLTKKQSSIAVGFGASTDADNSLAMGSMARVDGATSSSSIAIGNQAQVSVNKAVAIGNEANVNLDNSVALGYVSNTGGYTAETLARPGWVAKGAYSIPASTRVGVVSIGARGGERRIINVASGALDSDAVNVAQLRSLEERFDLALGSGSSSRFIQFVSVDKTQQNSDARKALALLQKEENYKYYLSLKEKALMIKARERAGEVFDSSSNSPVQRLKNDLAAFEAKNPDLVAYAASLRATEEDITNEPATVVSGNKRNISETAYLRLAAQIANAVEMDGLVDVNPSAEAKALMNTTNVQNDRAFGVDSMAIGYNAHTTAASHTSIAMGKNARINDAVDAIAIGNNATASVAGGVALGANSTIDRASGSFGFDVSLNNGNGQNSTSQSATWKSTHSAVSVGKADGTMTRQIVGVAAGTNDTDAVNVAQLKKAVGTVTYKAEEGAVTSVERKSSAAYEVNIKANENWGQENQNARYTGDNINTYLKTDGTVLVGMKTTPTFTNVTITGGPVLSSTGINMNDKGITKLASGLNGTAITAAAGDTLKNAVNVSDLQTVHNNLNTAINTKAAGGNTFKFKTEDGTAKTDARTWTLSTGSEITFAAENNLDVTADANTGKITYKLDTNATNAINTVNTKGVGFQGDSGTITRKLGESIGIKGGETATANLTETSSKNIGVIANGQILDVRLAKNLTALDSAQFGTTDNTKLTKDGLTITKTGDTDGLSITSTAITGLEARKASANNDYATGNNANRAATEAAVKEIYDTKADRNRELVFKTQNSSAQTASDAGKWQLDNNGTLTFKGGSDKVTVSGTGNAITFDVSQNVKDTLAKVATGTVANDNANTVTGDAVFDAVSAARTTVAKANGEDILKVDGGAQTGTNAKEYTLSLDKAKLKELARGSIDVIAKTGADNIAKVENSTNQATGVQTYTVEVTKADINNAITNTYAKLDASNLKDDNTNVTKWKEALGIANTSLKYKAGTENAAKDVALSTGLTFNSTTPNTLTISTDADGKVNFAVQTAEITNENTVAEGDKNKLVTAGEVVDAVSSLAGKKYGVKGETTASVAHEKTLGNTLTIKGDTKNIETSSDANALTVTLKSDLTELNSIAGSNGEGKITFAAGNKLDVNNGQITKLASGFASGKSVTTADLSADEKTNAVNVGDLQNTYTTLNTAKADKNLGNIDNDGKAKITSLIDVVEDTASGLTEENNLLEVRTETNADTKVETHHLSVTKEAVVGALGNDYAKLDASNLSEGNVTSWKTKLGIANIDLSLKGNDTGATTKTTTLSKGLTFSSDDLNITAGDNGALTFTLKDQAVSESNLDQALTTKIGNKVDNTRKITFNVQNAAAAGQPQAAAQKAGEWTLDADGSINFKAGSDLLTVTGENNAVTYDLSPGLKGRIDTIETKLATTVYEGEKVNFANISLSNINDDGKGVIHNATNVVASTDTNNIATVSNATEAGVKTYSVNVTKAAVADAVKDEIANNAGLQDKIAETVKLTYKADGDTASQTAKQVSLKTGLNFQGTANEIKVTTDADGVVKFDIETATLTETALNDTEKQKLITAGEVEKAISTLSGKKYGVKGDTTDSVAHEKKVGETLTINGDSKNITTKSTADALTITLKDTLTGINSITGADGSGKISFEADKAINVNGGQITNVASGLGTGNPAQTIANASGNVLSNAANIGDVKAAYDALDTAKADVAREFTFNTQGHAADAQATEAGKWTLGANDSLTFKEGSDAVSVTGTGKVVTYDLSATTKETLAKVGTGAVEANNQSTVTGDAVFDAVSAARTTVAKANDEDILQVSGGDEADIAAKNYTLSLDKDKLKELARGSVDVIAKEGDDNIAVLSNSTDPATGIQTYKVEVTKDKVQDAIKGTYAKLDASNVNGDNVTAWRTALGINDTPIKYKAGTDTDAKEVALSTGLHFNSTNTDALTITAQDDGKVDFTVNTGSINTTGYTANTGDDNKLITVSKVAEAIKQVVDNGLKVGANQNKAGADQNAVATHKLGNQIDIVKATAEIDENGVKYSGENLITKVSQDSNGKTIVEIGLKKQVETNEISIKNDQNKEVVEIKAGTDGKGEITISNGKDGTDGANATISVVPTAENDKGLDDTKKVDSRITYNDGNSDHTLATMDDGLTFAADSGADIKRKLSTTLNVKGGETTADNLTALTDKNIGVVANGETLEVRLAKELKGLTSAKFGATDTDNTTINADGIKIAKTGDDNGLTISSDKIEGLAARTADSVNKTVAEGELATKGYGAGENATRAATEGAVKELDDKIKKGEIAKGIDGRDGKDGTNGNAGSHGLTGKDGLNGLDLTDKVNALRNGEAGTVVYTNEQGERLVKANDGKYYKAADVDPETGEKKTADAQPVENPIASLVNSDGNTTTPTVFANVKGIVDTANAATPAPNPAKTIMDVAHDAARGTTYDNRVVTGKDLFSVIDNGLKVGANVGTSNGANGADKSVTHKLGKELQIVAAENTGFEVDGVTYSGGNLKTKVTQADGTTKVEIGLNSNVKAENLEVTELTVKNKLQPAKDVFTAGSTDDGDGVVKVNDKTGATGVTLGAKDGAGTIGLNGANGANATISVVGTEANDKGLDDNNKVASRIQYVDQTGKTHAVATMDDGLIFAGDDNENVTRELNTLLTIKGGQTDKDKLSDNNIGVVKDANQGVNGLTVKLAKELTGLTSAVFGTDAANTTINADGIKIAKTGDEKGLSITHDKIDGLEARNAADNLDYGIDGNENRAATEMAVRKLNQAIKGGEVGKGIDGKDGKNGLDTPGTAGETGLTGKDGLNGKSNTDKVNALRNGEAGPVVYTDANGNRLLKANDGKYYLASQVADSGYLKGDNGAELMRANDGNYYLKDQVGKDGNVITKEGEAKPTPVTTDLKPVENPMASLVNTDGNTTTPTVFGNLQGIVDTANVGKTADAADKKTIMDVAHGANGADGKSPREAFNNQAVTGKDLFSVIDNGLSIGANVGTSNDANGADKAVTHKLGKQLDVVAAKAGFEVDSVKYSGKNLITKVTQDAATGKTTVEVAMKEKIDLNEISIKNTNNKEVVGIKPDAEGKGTISISNGKDGENGANATISVVKAKDGEKGLDGQNAVESRIEYKDQAGNTHQVATLDDGLVFVGDDAQEVKRELNTKLTIKGNAADNAALSDGNIRVVKDATTGANGLVVKLAKDLKDLSSASFTDGTKQADPNADKLANVTTISKDGVSITTAGDKDGLNITSDAITGLADRKPASPIVPPQVNGEDEKVDDTYGVDANATRAATEGAVKYLYDKIKKGEVGKGKDGRDGQNGLDAPGTAGEKGLTGADGLNGKDNTDKVNALRNGEAGPVVYTDAEGKRLVKANDGNYYLAAQVNDDGTLKGPNDQKLMRANDGQYYPADQVDNNGEPKSENGIAATPVSTDLKPVENPMARLVNTKDGSTTEPTVLGNLKGIVDTENSKETPAGTKTIMDVAHAENNARDVYNNQAVTGKDLFSVIDNGLKVGANVGSSNAATDNSQTHKLGKQLDVIAAKEAFTVGADAQAVKYSGKNLITKVTQDTDGKTTIEVAMKDKIAAEELGLTNGKDGTNGVNGANATISVKPTDGTDGTNGTDAVNGINGKDGVAGAKGEKGDKGLDGTHTIESRIVYNDGNSTHALATMDDGLIFKGDTADANVTRKLNTELTIKGGEETKDKLTALADKNIGVVTDSANNTLEVRLAKELKGLTSANFGDAAANTTITKDGLTIATADKPKDLVITKDAIEGLADRKIDTDATPGADGKTTYAYGMGENATRAATEGAVKDLFDKMTRGEVGKGNDGRDGLNGGEGTAGSQGLTGKDGLNGKDNTAKVNALRNGEAGPVVYTDADGNRLVKGNDGNYYKPDEIYQEGDTLPEGKKLGDVKDGKTPVANPMARLVNTTGATTTPTVFGNLQGVVDTANAATPAATPAKTIMDVAHAGDTRNVYNNQAVTGKDLFSVIDNGLVIGAEFNKDNQVANDAFVVQKLGKRIDIKPLGNVADGEPITITKTVKEKETVYNDQGKPVMENGKEKTQIVETEAEFTGENLATKVEQDENGNTTVSIALRKQLKIKELLLSNGTFGNTTKINGDGIVIKDKDSNATTTINGKGVFVKNQYENHVSNVTFDTEGNGLIQVNDKDGKDGVSITAKDGVGFIGLNGKDGANANISVVKAKDGEKGLDGQNAVESRIEYKDQAGNTHQVATLDDGLVFAGDDNANVTRELNTLLTIKGGQTDATKLSDNNIGVVKDTAENANGLVVKLAKELTGLTSAKFGTDTDNTVINKDGLTITKAGDNDGLTVTADSIKGLAARTADTTTDYASDVTRAATEGAVKELNDKIKKGEVGKGNDGRDGKDGSKGDAGVAGATGLTGKDGLNGADLTDKVNALRNGEAGPVVYTDENGERVYKANNGKYYKKDGIDLETGEPKEGAQPVENPMARLANSNGETTTPTVFGNLQGVVDTAKAAAPADKPVNSIMDIAHGDTTARDKFNNQAVTGKDLFSVIDNGLKVGADQGNDVTHKLGKQLDVVAAKESFEVDSVKYSGKNLITKVTQDANGTTTVEVAMKEKIAAEELGLTNGKDGKDGVNGANATISVKPTDGTDGTNGKNGENGINGTDGVAGAKGEAGDKGLDGKHTIESRIVYNDGNSTHALATMDDGLIFKGDTANANVTRKLNTALTIKGGEETADNLTTLADKNIGVVTDSENHTLEVRLAKNLTGLESVTVGTADNGTSITAEGTKVTDGTTTAETTKDGLKVSSNDAADKSETVYGKDGLTIKGADGKDAVSLTNTVAADGTAKPTLAFAKDGAVTGLADRTVDTTKPEAGKDGYGTGENKNRAATEGAVKELNDKIVNGQVGAGKDGRDGKNGLDIPGTAGETGLTGADGLNGKDVVTKVNALRNGEAGPVVYTDADGKRLVKANDGKYYLANQVKDDGTLVDGATAVANPIASLVNSTGETTKPTTFANVAHQVRPNSVADKTAITAGDAQKAVAGDNKDDKGGLLTATEGLTNAVTKGDLQAVAKAGLSFVGDDGQTVHRPLGTELSIKGGADKARLTAGNIGIVKDTADNGLVVQLAKDLKGLDTVAVNNTVTVGTGSTTTQVAAGGVTVTGADGSTTQVAAGDVTVTGADGSAVNVTSNSITGLADLNENSPGHAAANKNYVDSQLGHNNHAVQQVNHRIDEMDKDLRAGIAGSVAMSTLVQAYNPSDSMISVGTGTYRGASALAVGYSQVSDSGKVIIKFSGSVNNAGHYMGGASVGFKF